MRIHTERLHRLAANLVLKNFRPGLTRLDRVPYFIFERNNREIQVEPQIFSIVNLMPEIFPLEWMQNENGEFVWREDTDRQTIISFGKYFNIDFPMLGHLLIPGAQLVNLYGGLELYPLSYNQEIAINIYGLIEAQEIWLDLPAKFNINISKN